MKTCSLLLLVLMALVAGTQAGKKMKQCKADKQALEEELEDLKAQLQELKDAPAPVCTPAPTEGPTDPPVHSGMLGFWPLNEKYGGKNLARPGIDFRLTNVEYDVGNGDFSSAPAKFSPSSNAVLTGAKDIRLVRSFSWIAAVYRRGSADGPLFEWDDNPRIGTHIWVYKGKLYINMYRDRCGGQTAFHSAAVPVGEWVTLAVTFDGKTLSLYQNGVKTDVVAKACDSQLSSYNYIRINQRGSSTGVSADMTCFGLFREALSYDELVASTIDKC